MVATFMLAIYSRGAFIPYYPLSFFQSIGFNDLELEMALKAATLKQQSLRRAELNKEIAEEMAAIERGIELTHFSSNDENNGITQPSFVFYIFGDSIHVPPARFIDGYLNDYYVEYRFYVFNNGEFSHDILGKVKPYGIDSIRVVNPATKHFKALDTNVSITSVNNILISAYCNSIRDENKSYTANVCYDKKTNRWIIKKCENKYGKLKDWFTKNNSQYLRDYSPSKVLEIDSYEKFLDLLSEKCNSALIDKKGKEYSVQFTLFPPGEVTYYINNIRRIHKCKIGLVIQLDKLDRIK